MKNDGPPYALFLRLFPKLVLRTVQHPYRTITQARMGILLGRAFKNSKNQRDEKAVLFFARALALLSRDEIHPMVVDAYLAKARSHDRLGQFENAKESRAAARLYKARIRGQ